MSDMSDKTGKKKFGKSELLLDAALTEFSEKDYEQASLNNILDASGVGKGNFYYHFHNKETLFLAVVERVVKDKLDFLARRDIELSGSKDIFAMLRVHGRLSEEFALSDPRIEGLIYQISGEMPPSLRGKVDAIMGAGSSSYFEDMVFRAIEKKEIRDDLPPVFVVKLLSFLFANFARAFIRPGQPGKPDKARILEDFERYMDFIERGLRK